MTMIQSLRERRIHGSWDCLTVKPRLDLYQIFEHFTCHKEDEHTMVAAEEGGVVPLPFSCGFSRSSSSQLLAVANEDGKVHLIDTLKSKESCVRTWQAHVNAVFDIAWVPNEDKLVTGSGDQTAQLWDVETTKCLSVFKGHTCSLRTIDFRRDHSNVFATGARDGNIMLWDTRTRPMKSGYFKPVNILYGVHSVETAGRRTSASLRNESQHSVTTVLFKGAQELYSSGAADGSIKLWDLRRHYTTAKGAPLAKQVYPYVGTAARKNGISCLSLTNCGTYLFSNCTDDNIYMYQTRSDTRDPVSVFSGHTNSTFYVKSTVTHDNRFLISGSSSHSLFVWDISRPYLAPVTLGGHTGEVTSVACSSDDLGRLVSCSDDNTVRVWRLHDQMSLCTGQRVGAASRLQNHTPTTLSSLNLVEPTSPGSRTPDSRNQTTTPHSSRKRSSEVKTPSSRKKSDSRSAQAAATLLTPSRRYNSRHVEGRRLPTISEDHNKPGPSSETPAQSSSSSTQSSSSSTQSSSSSIQPPSSSTQPSSSSTQSSSASTQPSSTEPSCFSTEPSSSSSTQPSSSSTQPSSCTPPTKQKSGLLRTPSSSSPRRSSPRTPGKISSYYRLSSSEKKCISPLRHSPRLTKGKMSRIQLLNSSTSPTIGMRSSPRKHAVDEAPAPMTPKKGTAQTPTKKNSSPLKKGGKYPSRRVDKSPAKRNKVEKNCQLHRINEYSEAATNTDTTGRSISTQTSSSSSSSSSVSCFTQTSSPVDCTFSCKTCCRNYVPLYNGAKAATVASNTGSVSTPPTHAAGRVDLTPRSCSNSSVPRRTRIHHADGSIPTTPTKGTVTIATISPRTVRRKFTSTGTPIHRNNCRCTFCVSTATEMSELSSSPILEMPHRPRKRLISAEEEEEQASKRRKSLFGRNVGEETQETLSCSPYSQDKENCSKQESNSPEERVTVRSWLRQDEDTHDHAQCSSLHCIRSFFTSK